MAGKGDTGEKGDWKLIHDSNLVGSWTRRFFANFNLAGNPPIRLPLATNIPTNVLAIFRGLEIDKSGLSRASAYQGRRDRPATSAADKITNAFGSGVVTASTILIITGDLKIDGLKSFTHDARPVMQ